MSDLNIPVLDEQDGDSLKIKLSKTDAGILIVELMGYLDTYNSQNFEKRVIKVIDAGFNILVFDCSSLTYVSSTGIGSFTAFHKRVKTKDGNIVLFGLQPKVMEVFHLLGFSQFFTIKNSLDESVGFLKLPGASEKQEEAFVFTCPVCAKKMKVQKTGRFRCSSCKSILAVGNNGGVTVA